ncbi:MAG: hypothetical protein ACREGB_03030 [Candidatus Saccharimonadales bacterium]
MTNIEHVVCDGCESGSLQAALVDRMNALDVESHEYVLQVQKEAIDQIRLDAATNIARVPLARMDLERAAAVAEGHVRALVSVPLAPERVVCPRANTAEAGPRGWLQRCGACKVTVQ